MTARTYCSTYHSKCGDIAPHWEEGSPTDARITDMTRHVAWLPTSRPS